MTNQNKQQTNSISLDLENLQKKYNNLLIKYQQAVSNYVSFLNSLTLSKSQPMTQIKGSVYWGTTGVGQTNAGTIQDCQALCSNTPGCSGATFNQSDHGRPICWLRGGESSIVGGLPNDYAIIPKSKQLLLTMEDINQQLITVNTQIVNKIKASEPEFYKNNAEGTRKSQELVNNYKNLMKERAKLLELLDQYETLNNTEDENQIKITKNYYSYILLFILALVVSFLLFKISYSGSINTSSIQYGGELGINAYYILFVIIIIIIIINYAVRYFYI